MSKRSDRRQRQELFERVIEIADDSQGHGSAPIDDATLAQLPDLKGLVTPPGTRRELTKLKKFRFQLLHQWMIENLTPCRAADIGGGKGLLAYLLNQSGWEASVIDPVHQGLPTKYKDLAADRQIKLAESESVPRFDQPFAPELAADFDLLVAMHAHGCNVQLIDAAAHYRRRFLVLPCCIIQEPLRPAPGVHWLQCVADYSRQQGFILRPFRLNFKGQNIGLYARCPEHDW